MAQSTMSEYCLMSLIPSYDVNIITDKIQFSIKFYTEAGRNKKQIKKCSWKYICYWDFIVAAATETCTEWNLLLTKNKHLQEI